MKVENFDRVLGRIFLVLIVVVVVGICLEVLSSWYLPSRPSYFKSMTDGARYRVPQPYVVFGGEPHYNGLNAHGYTGKYPSMPKEEGEYRICVLGGSTVFNGIPFLMEELLQARGLPDVRVYNFGVFSSVSGMELARIVYEIVDLDPDLVVMYGGGNDILDKYTDDPRPGYPYNYTLYNLNPLLIADVKKYHALGLYFFGSNLCRYIFRDYFTQTFFQMDSLRKEIGWMSDEWQQSIVDTYVGNIRKAHMICRAYGINFMAVFQPLLHFKKELVGEAERVWGSDEGQRDYAIRMWKRITTELQRVRQFSSVEIADISAVFTESGAANYVDYIHLNEESKKIVASTVSEYIHRRYFVTEKRGL